MPSRRRAMGGLEGERSPWKDRAFTDRQRSGNVTDSSAEQSPGVGHSSGGRGVGDGLTGLRSRSWEAIREGRGTRVQRRSQPTSVGGDGSSGDGSAFLLNGTPGRSGLRSRDNDADPTQAGDERSKPGRQGAPGLPGAATSVAGVARQGTRDPASAWSKCRRGDVGVHLGGPEHHHHGQGSTLNPKASSKMPPATSAGRDDASRVAAVTRPLAG